MDSVGYLDELTQIPEFESCIKDAEVMHTLPSLDVMQINVGRLCNLACKHCHVEAGPAREEIMSREVMEACLQVCREQGFKTIDITGGAPEMNPDFEWLVAEASKICSHIIVRTNLAILLEDEYKHLPEFYARHKVELACSLPYYRAKDVDRQRGQGVFDRSIAVLRKLNELGYGRNPELVINLVYNPGGAFLPPEQTAIEKEFKAHLESDFGIVFNHMFTIANNPTGRFAGFLHRTGNLEGYMNKLYAAFNEGTLETMMCRSQLSVGWDGKLYDCDFNQAAGLPVVTGETIFDLVGKPYKQRSIRFGKHCFACTAGQGSSCGGATV
jgi:radical SAM/Cys-rich protein